MNRRIYILLILLVAVLGVVAQEFVSGGLRYAVTAPGEVAVVSNWVDGRNDYEGVIVIPEQVYCDGATHRVTAIADDAFAASAVTCVQVPASVTAIGTGAMADAEQLTDVTLPLHLTTVSPYLLAGTAVTDVVIPEGVTAIGEGAFQDCTQLHTVMLPSTMAAIDSVAFEGCYNLFELYCAAPTPPAIAGESAFDDLRHVDVMVADDDAAYAYADHPMWGNRERFDLWTVDEPWTAGYPMVDMADDDHFNSIALAGNHLAYEVRDDWGDLVAVTAASNYYTPTPRREKAFTITPTNLVAQAVDDEAEVTLLAPAAIEEIDVEAREFPQVVVHDGAIHIMGDNHGKWLQIYDAYGMLYYQRPANDGVIDGLPHNRVYIVIVGDRATKVCL